MISKNRFNPNGVAYDSPWQRTGFEYIPHPQALKGRHNFHRVFIPKSAIFAPHYFALSGLILNIHLVSQGVAPGCQITPLRGFEDGAIYYFPSCRPRSRHLIQSFGRRVTGQNEMMSKNGSNPNGVEFASPGQRPGFEVTPCRNR